MLLLLSNMALLNQKMHLIMGGMRQAERLHTLLSCLLGSNKLVMLLLSPVEVL